MDLIVLVLLSIITAAVVAFFMGKLAEHATIRGLVAEQTAMRQKEIHACLIRMIQVMRTA